MNRIFPPLGDLFCMHSQLHYFGALFKQIRPPIITLTATLIAGNPDALPKRGEKKDGGVGVSKGGVHVLHPNSIDITWLSVGRLLEITSFSQKAN